MKSNGSSIDPGPHVSKQIFAAFVQIVILFLTVKPYFSKLSYFIYFFISTPYFRFLCGIAHTLEVMFSVSEAVSESPTFHHVPVGGS